MMNTDENLYFNIYVIGILINTVSLFFSLMATNLLKPNSLIGFLWPSHVSIITAAGERRLWKRLL